MTSRERCSAGASCFDPALEANDHYDVGVTALALLAFLDAGFTHESESELVDGVLPGRRYDVGEVVGAGLRWLREQQQPDGSFAVRPFLYNEALATTALSEVLRTSGSADWEGPAQRAADFLQAAQRRYPQGEGLWGWGYDAQGESYDANLSVTATCFLALLSALHADLRVEPSSIAGARRYCEFVTANDGLVGYRDPKEAGATVTGPFDDQFDYHYTAMTALGMCIRFGSSSDLEEYVLQVSAKRICMDPPHATEDRSSIDYSYWHHATLALGTLDGGWRARRTGKYWDPWRKELVATLLSLQAKDQLDCAKGGWLTSDRWGSYCGAGPLYNTAMNVRTLAICFHELSSPPPKHPLLGDLAPEIVAIEGPGSRFVLSELRGKVVLIDFLSSDAAGFDMDVQARSSFARRMKGERFAMLTICMTDSAVDPFPPRATRAEWPWTCIRVRDANDPILQEYKVSKFPTTIVVDPAGKVRGAPAGWDDTVVQVNFLLDLERRRGRK